MLGLPPLTYYMWICLRYFGGALVLPTSGDAWLALAARVPGPTLEAAVLYGCWLLLQVVLQVAGPGKLHAGPLREDGSWLSYKMNGWFALWCTLAVLAVAVAAGWVSPTVAYDAFGPLLTTAHLVAFAFSLYLYLHGLAARHSTATGNFIYDYFMGVALNPRVGSFDWKFFCESRPGLIL
jgi:delta14-sterol reductase/lamin-B receptor